MNPLRVAFLMVLSFIAGGAAHFYYNTWKTVEDAKTAQVQDADAMAELDARLTGEGGTLPVTKGNPDADMATSQLAGSAGDRAERMLRLVNTIESNNAEVIDSRAFDSKEECDAAVRKVSAEYAKRGIPSTDMVETSPFPESTGLVVMLRNDNNLYYAGCVTNAEIDWAAYVHFKPKK